MALSKKNNEIKPDSEKINKKANKWQSIRNWFSGFLDRSRSRLSRWKIQKVKQNVIEEILPDSPRTAYRKELVKGFLYPPWMKKQAWILSTVFILVSHGMVLYEGLYSDIGILWSGVLTLSLVLLFFVIQPLVIIIYAAVIKYIYHFPREIYYKEFPAKILENPDDPTMAELVQELRLNDITSYVPTPDSIIQEKRAQLYLRKQRLNVLIDIAKISIILTFLLLVGIEESSSSLYLRRTVANLVNYGKYTNSTALKDVSSLEQFQGYLWYTLIPALLTNGSEIKNIRPPLRLVDVVTELQHRGWTRDWNLKLIGQPRIFQQRVISFNCVRQTLRQRFCQEELTPFNHDNANYGVSWEPLLRGEDQLGHKEIEPWLYRSWKMVESSPWFGRLSTALTYGQGGYFLFLGKNLINAQATAFFMHYFDWIDYQTRVIFIDFVAYAPGVNLFNVATITFEVSATGVFIPSYRMNVGIILDKNPIYYTAEFAKLTVMIIIVGYLLSCIFSKCRVVGIAAYLNNGWECLNVLQSLIGVSCILASSLAILYGSELEDKLDTAADDQYINFQFYFFWKQAKNNLFAFLVGIEMFKFIRCLRYLKPYNQFQRMVGKSLKYAIILLVCIFYLCLLFGLLFQQLMGKEEDQFYSLSRSITTMFGYTIGTYATLDSTILNHNLPFLTALFFLVFILIAYVAIFAMLRVTCAANIEAIYDKPLSCKNLLPKRPDNRGKAECLIRRNVEISGMSIPVLRFQQMTRVALETVTSKNYRDETALAVANFTLAGYDENPASQQYFLVRGTHMATLDNQREQQMRQLTLETITPRKPSVSFARVIPTND